MTYNLDKVLISSRIYHTWVSMARVNVERLIKVLPNLRSTEIPDEQFRVLEDGVGEIFITIRSETIKMKVPKDEYEITG